MSQPDVPKPETPLESWKEIASYLQRDARTVRRWEQAEGLPVRRHQHRARSSVYAYPSELDAWRAGRGVAGARNQSHAPSTAGTIAAALAVIVLSAGSGSSAGPIGVEAQGVVQSVVFSPQRPAESIRTATMSAEGRYLAYLNGLVVSVRDVTTGTVKAVSPRGDGTEWPEFSAISRDAGRIVFTWFNGERYQLRLAAVQEEGVAEPTVVVDDPELEYLEPFDWSPDGRRVALVLARKDKTRQIAILTVDERRLDRLTTLDWNGTTRVLFSPDGRWVAYDAVTSNDGTRDVFVMAVDGSRRALAVGGPSHDVLSGWAPDGRSLLFQTDRGGRMGLGRVPIVDGRAAGAPVMLRPDFDGEMVGVTSTGTVVFVSRVGQRQIQMSTVDLSTGRLIEGPVTVAPRYAGLAGPPDFTPDGAAVSFITSDEGVGIPRLVVQSLENGATRELPVPLKYFRQATWTADGRSVVAQARDDKGRPGVFLVDVDSGDITRLLDDGCSGPQLSRDRDTLFCRRRLEDGSFQFIAHSLRTGEERVILPSPQMVSQQVSPDERYLAAVEWEGGVHQGPDAHQQLVLVPLDGGEPRVLYRTSEDEPLSTFLTWTADNQRLLVTQRGAEAVERDNGQAGRPWYLWSIALDGTRTRIDIGFPTIGSENQIHPDGRRIAFMRGRDRYEVWKLEGILAGPDSR